MSFTTPSFLVFLIILFISYYFLLKEKTHVQNLLLLSSSYFFYAYANWRLLPILIIATLVYYWLGSAIFCSVNPKRKYFLSLLGAILGVGLLIYFKYFNFFISSFAHLFNFMGLKANVGTFDIIVPIGISFFTFKLISYTIEIKKGKMEPCENLIAFATYVAFFPTILSGPIDRPYNFIPQLFMKRVFNYSLAVGACRQILWGAFQKMVIADNLAEIVNKVWRDIPGQSSGVLIITAILYSLQLYTDFSGYSNMAIGVGKIFGFKITKNFEYPFFGRNISEFWKKWHISLTSWLTDYVFMPLNIQFRNFGTLGIILAILINMVLVGIWHGANWTFIIFGFYNGLLFIPIILSGTFLKKKKLKSNQYGLPSLSDFGKMLVTFLLVTIGFVIFRAENIGQAMQYFLSIFDMSIYPFNLNEFRFLSLNFIPIFFSILLIGLEWHSREDEYAIAQFGLNWHKPYRILFYYTLIFLIILCSPDTQNQFIYFKF